MRSAPVAKAPASSPPAARPDHRIRARLILALARSLLPLRSFAPFFSKGSMEFPGEKLVTQLWETVAEKGIGNIFKPGQILREGRAHSQVQVERIVMLAQAEHRYEYDTSRHQKTVGS